MKFRGSRRAVALGVTGATIAAVAVGFTGLAWAEPAGEIRAAGGPDAVKGSFIVVLKESAVAKDHVDSAARRLAARNGGQVRGNTWSEALRGFEFVASDKKARRLAADPAVAYVEQTHLVRIQGTQTNPPSYGLDRLDQANLPLNRSYTFPANTGGNVRAYIVDTGIRFTHSDFRRANGSSRAVTGFDAVTPGGRAVDCNGHGTHVAGTVGGNQFGVAKGVQLVAVRVLDCEGSGTTAQVIGGINFVTRDARGRGPAVANMSLGGGPNTAIDNAVRNSVASGVTFAVAAGNGNDAGVGVNACGESPARVGVAITVGATDRNDRRAGFSNIGRCVDIFAPGVAITSAGFANDNARATFDGTSMATPHVTGAAALVLAANPTFTPAQVTTKLLSDATPNVLRNIPGGTVNRLLRVR